MKFFPILLLLLVPSLSLGADPNAVAPCVDHCAKLEKTGDLRPGVSVEGCLNRLCQREARQLYADGKYEQALLSLEPLHRRLKSSPSYRLDLGLILYALGRFEEALASFDAAIEQFPNTLRIASQRAHTLVRLSRLPEARAQFQKLVENPATKGEFKKLRTRSYLHGNIGIVWLIEGSAKKAKQSLEQALEIDGRNKLAATYLYKVTPSVESGDLAPEGVQQLLVAFEELGLKRRDRAARELATLVQRWPRFALGYRRLADILRGYQRYQDCESVLIVAQQNLPKNAEIRAERIRCTLLRHGPGTPESQAAEAELRKLAEANPDNNFVQDVLIALEL